VLFGDYATRDFTTLVSIVGYPMWATTYNCGGGLHENWQPAWREFVREAVARYSKSPYNVHLWEIGNEVDGETTVDPDDYDRPPDLGQGQPTVPYAGCWGDMAADYLSFMRAAYEEIHGQDSSAQVLIGSLAYDQFENWFVEDFFPNVLDAGGGAYFDVLGFHWYPFSTQAWPTANGKAQDIAAIMQSRGIQKPLWLTETYRWTHSVDPNSPRAQFDFVLHELPRMAGGGIIQRAIWFGMWDFNPGRSPIGRGMVDFWHQPKPALRAMEAMSGLAYGFPTDVGNNQVEAYRFDRPWALESVYALWSRDSSSHDFSVAAAKPVQRVRVFFANTYTDTQVVTDTLVPSGGQVTAHAEQGTQFRQSCRPSDRYLSTVVGSDGPREGDGPDGLRTPCSQGASAGGERGPGGTHVIHEQGVTCAEIRTAAGERAGHVGPSLWGRQANLRRGLASAPQGVFGQWETGPLRQPSRQQGRLVVAAFPFSLPVQRNRHNHVHGRRRIVHLREQQVAQRLGQTAHIQILEMVDSFLKHAVKGRHHAQTVDLSREIAARCADRLFSCYGTTTAHTEIPG